MVTCTQEQVPELDEQLEILAMEKLHKKMETKNDH